MTCAYLIQRCSQPVEAKPLEGRMADLAVGRDLGIIDVGDQAGLDPSYCPRFPTRVVSDLKRFARTHVLPRRGKHKAEKGPGLASAGPGPNSASSL
jgi:hypothetical protein